MWPDFTQMLDKSLGNLVPMPSLGPDNLGGVVGTALPQNFVNNFSSTLPVQGGGGADAGGIFGRFLDTPAGPGWGGMALGALQGLGNSFMAMKQYGLYKDALRQSREQFEKNYAAQRQTTNTALEDRQAARVASNPSAYESVASYMDRNRIR